MAPTLGRCGACSMQFTSSLYAYTRKCVVCKKNFHPKCLKLDENYAKEATVFTALSDINCIVCKTCRELGPPALLEKDGKRLRDGTAAAADEEQIAALTAQVKKLTEDNKLMESRILAPQSAASKVAEDLQIKLEAANQKIARLETIAFSTPQGTNIDKAAMEKLSLLEKETLKLKNDNAKLLAENTVYTERFQSLQRKHEKSKERRQQANMDFDQPSIPSTPTDPPIVITTANMESLVCKPLKSILAEIRQEFRASASKRPPSIGPILCPSRLTYADMTASQPLQTPNRRRSQSRRSSGPTRNNGPTPREAAFQTVARKQKNTAQPLRKANQGRTLARRH